MEAFVSIHAARKILYVFLFTLLIAALCPAQEISPSRWMKFQFLLGSWNAAGSGSPGEAAGDFSFTFDLQDKVLVRRSHSEYPAAPNRPAFAHDDLMVIYADEKELFHADYHDNEGHVIRYMIEFSGDGNTCTFVSEPSIGRPRFRLTYSKVKEDQVAIKFEIAPADHPNSFQEYVGGTAKREPSSPARSGEPVRLPDDLVNFLSGNWDGSGESASGSKIEAEVSFVPALDAQWLLYRHMDRSPNKYKALGMWGFENTSGRFIMVVNDNFGGSRRFLSESWEHGKIVFENVTDAVLSAKAIPSPAANRRERFTFERQDANTFKMTYETNSGGQNWRLGDYLIFRRRA